MTKPTNSADRVLAAIELPDGMTVEDLQRQLEAAVAGLAPDEEVWAFVEATEDGFIVVNRGSRLMRHSWSLDDGEVTVSATGSEVVRHTTYEEKVTASFTFGVVRASKGRTFEIRVIGTGPGLNEDRFGPWFVEDTPEGIGSAQKVFGGARVYWHRQVDGGFDHLDGDVRSWLGSDRDAGYLSNLRTSDDGLFATLHVDEDVPEEVVAALREKALGFSVECEADRVPLVRGGKSYSALRNFRHPSDGQARVAIVTHPALRGEVIRLAASVKKETAVSDTTKTGPDPSAQDDMVTAARNVQEELQAELTKARVANGRTALESTLQASKLPESAVDLVRDRFEPVFASGSVPSDEDVTAAIDKARKAVQASEPGVSGEGPNVSIGTEPRDRLEWRLVNFFGRNAPGYVRAGIQKEWGKTLDDGLRDMGLPTRQMEPSFLRLFREHTGHEFVDLRSGNRKKVMASISQSTFGDLWENVLHRMFLLSYSEIDVYQDWRKVARVVPVSNFLKQERAVQGGYANLSIVVEGADYTALTSPGDEGHGYTPQKRGNTEDVTWEAMLRDDVGAMAQIPTKLATAAARTLYEFVFDLYKVGSTVSMDYDSTTLYAATTHSNLGTSALTATSAVAARLAMRNQTDLSNSKKLAVRPRFLMIPDELEDEAFDILKPLDQYPGGSTTDNAFVRSLRLEPIVVEHWTNAGDHVYAADPFEFPTCEVGFINGQEMPELFTQDDRNLGSYFDADKITWKVRHAYGGTILRHEGVYGQDV